MFYSVRHPGEQTWHECEGYDPGNVMLDVLVISNPIKIRCDGFVDGPMELHQSSFKIQCSSIDNLKFAEGTPLVVYIQYGHKAEYRNGFYINEYFQLST